MHPVALALVPRIDQERASALVPSLIEEAKLPVPLWFTTVVDGVHGEDCIRQISRIHTLEMIINFGLELPSWPDTRNMATLLVEGQIQPVRYCRMPPFRKHGLWMRSDASKLVGANLRQAMMLSVDAYPLNLGLSEN